MLDILNTSAFVLHTSGNYRYYNDWKYIFFFKLGAISGIITIHIFLCNIGYNVRFCNTCSHINREKNGMPVILNDIALLTNF